MPMFTLCNVCLCRAHFHPSYMFLFRAHKHIWYTCSFHSRVFMFSVCAYYRNASGPRQGRVHVLCVCLLHERQRAQKRPCSFSVRVSTTGTPVGPDKAPAGPDKAVVFMFGACACCSNASGPEQSRVHVRCLCLLQQRQRTETRPCSCLVRVLITGTSANRDKAVFMFGACAYYSNASGSRQSRVHVRCVCLSQERQSAQWVQIKLQWWAQTKPCSCSVCVPVAGTPAGPEHKARARTQAWAAKGP